MKPEPIAIPADLREAAHATMSAAKFPMFASMDGTQPRVRPVSPVKTDGFVVYVASLRSSHKTEEVQANDLVELCYLDEGHDQVRITGTCEHVTDRAVLEDVWNSNALLRAFLRSIDNPEFILYRVNPRRVRFMREWALDYHDVPL